MDAHDLQEDTVADESAGPENGSTSAEESDSDASTEASDTSKRFQRKRPSKGMKMKRVREIRALIDEGRQHEVPAEEMAEFKRNEQVITDSLKSHFAGAGTSTIKAAVDPKIVADLQRKLSAPVLRNKTIADNLGLSPMDREQDAESLSEKIAQPKRPSVGPSFSQEWLTRMQDAQVAEAREKRERQDRAQQAADENNALLTEVARILQSVESSSNQSRETLDELRTMRRSADRSSGQQSLFNILIAAAALVVAIAQAFGLGGDEDDQSTPQPTVTITATPTTDAAGAPTPGNPASPTPPSAQETTPTAQEGSPAP
jgi:hypothetical protein